MLKIIIASLLLVTSCGYNAAKKYPPVAKDGILDLRGWDLEKNGPVKLDGEWNFF